MAGHLPGSRNRSIHAPFRDGVFNAPRSSARRIACCRAWTTTSHVSHANVTARSGYEVGVNISPGHAEPAGLAGRAGQQVRGVDEAIQQRDAADEGRLEASGGIMIGQVIVNEGKVVRPSQLIASVGRTRGGACKRG